MYRLPNEFRWASSLDAEDLHRRVASPSAIARAGESVDAMRVVFFGRLGSGKTSLAIAMARAAMVARDVNGMYCAAPELDLARDDLDHRIGDPDFMQRAIEVPVLVLDELGNESGTSGTVAGVLKARHHACRQTLLVSVLTSEGLRARYQGGTLRSAFAGAAVIVCDGEQPPARVDVRRVKPGLQWTPPPPRVPSLPAEAASPAALVAAIERIGAPLHVEPADIAERQRVLRAQAAALRAIEDITSAETGT